MNIDIFKKMVRYVPESGIFVWTSAQKRSDIVGKRAESLSVGTYQKAYYEVSCRVSGKRHRVKSHRLAWYFSTGHMPTKHEEIDHIDGNGANNRFDNLRLVSKLENQKNQKMKKNNKSGHCGVCWYARDKNWQAEIYVNNVRMFLGRYKTLEEAVKVRKDAELKYNFHPNHGAERPLYSVQELIGEATLCPAQ